MTFLLAIDFVSPLPPVRSEISDSSLDLLPNLDQLCDLPVMQLLSRPMADALQDWWEPVVAIEKGVLGESGTKVLVGPRWVRFL
jgi:hypothetical protein